MRFQISFTTFTLNVTVPAVATVTCWRTSLIATVDWVEQAGLPNENCRVFPVVLITVWPPRVAALNQPVVAVDANAAEKSPFLSTPAEELLEVEAACVAVGVPLITPLLDSVKPCGSDDPFANVHVNGPVPPVLARVVEYADPRVAPGTVVVVIVGTGLTVTVTEFDCVVEVDVVVVVDVKMRIFGCVYHANFPLSMFWRNDPNQIHELPSLYKYQPLV